ncbi:MAG: polyprenyl synthetase family protein [Chromatiales bacterium]|nr:polyprenyl synthetase family protein [Chromatiales bacterium]
MSATSEFEKDSMVLFNAMNGVSPDYQQPIAYAQRVGFDQSSVAELQARVNYALAELAPRESSVAEELADAIRFSLLAPGKRVRALVALLAAADLGFDRDAVLYPACAVELLHTASLVVDDLPAMDDADLRRGLESSHVRFGEDTAILAAITMLSDAFGVVARCDALDPVCRNEIVIRLSAGTGLTGLAAGQLLDLRSARGSGSANEVERIHRLKTGALFASSAWIGGRVAEASPATLEALDDFGMQVGLAFQAYDDLADRLASLESVGKNVQADTRKATMVALAGTDAAEARADALFEASRQCLERIGLGDRRLAVFVSELRDKLKSRMHVEPASSADSANAC